jgi:hypothetical protein
VLRIEPSASSVLSTRSTTELHPQPLYVFFGLMSIQLYHFHSIFYLSLKDKVIVVTFSADFFWAVLGLNSEPVLASQSFYHLSHNLSPVDVLLCFVFFLVCLQCLQYCYSAMRTFYGVCLYYSIVHFKAKFNCLNF